MRSNYEGFFTDLKNDRPYFKMAFHGMAGSGKSFTAMRVAGGLYKRIESNKPIVIFDTETSAKFMAPTFKQGGIPVKVKTSRTLSDLMDTLDYADAGNADIVIIDSITHVWENFVEAYKKKKNRTFIHFEDWSFLKPEWKRCFSDRLVMGRNHCIFTGRQGDVYEQEVNEEGKKELVKVGVKMRAEKDTAYEPDFLVMMELCQDLSQEPMKVFRRATVLKDRSDILDGKSFSDPSFAEFAPAIEFILAGEKNGETMNVSGHDEDLIRTEEDNRSAKREQQVWLERCNAILDKYAYGTSRESKAKRIELTEYAFHGETSDLAIAAMSVEQLMEAHNRLKEKLEPIDEKAHLIDRIITGEKYIYPVARAVEAARSKYIGTQDLDSVDWDTLQKYFSHIHEKYNEMKAKGAKS